MIDTSTLQVINGSDLMGEDLGQNDSGFFKPPKRYTEQEYLQYLQSQQELLRLFKAGEIVIDPDYINNSTETDLVTKPLPLIKTSDEKYQINYETPINLIKTTNGYKFAGGNGRHRFYVTKKYNLDILAHIIAEVSEELAIVGTHWEYDIGKLKYIVDLHKVDGLYAEGICKVQLHRVTIAFAKMQCDSTYEMRLTVIRGLLAYLVKKNIVDAFTTAANEGENTFYYFSKL